MIKRFYFMSTRIHHDDDGSGSFSYYSTLTVQRSWLAKPHKAYEYMLQESSEALQSKLGDRTGKLEIVSFGRC